MGSLPPGSCRLAQPQPQARPGLLIVTLATCGSSQLSYYSILTMHSSQLSGYLYLFSLKCTFGAGWVAQLVGASAGIPEGCEFNPRWGTFRGQTIDASLTPLFSSLSPFLSL